MTFSIKKKTLKKVVASLTMFATVVSMSGMMALSTVVAAEAIAEGALIKSDAVNTDGTPTYESLDVYIVKIVGEKKFKRVILNPTVFESYGHLNWSDIQTVSQAVMDEYTTSSLVRVDTDPDEKVFAMAPDDDIGSKSWVNLTTDEFVTDAGSDPDSIYTINSVDGGNYTEVGDIATVTELTTFYSTGNLPDLTPVPAGALTVTLSADTPAAASVPLTAPSVDMLKFNLSAPADGALTVSTLVLNKTGLGASGAVSNVYLYDGEARLTNAKSVNSTYKTVTFNNLDFVVPAGETKTLTVKATLITTAGIQHGFSINAVDNITVASGTVSGSFPISGNIMSTATVSDLGTVIVARSGSSSVVAKIGSTDLLLGKFTLATAQENSSFKGITIYSSGNDIIDNLAIYRGSDLLGTAVKNGKYHVVTFDEADSIAKGETITYTIKGDVSSDNTNNSTTLAMRYDTDVNITGDSYGYGMAVTNTFDTNVHTITLEAGAVTIAFNGPSTGNVSVNTSNVTLFDFSIYAQSDTKIERDEFILTLVNADGDTDVSLANTIENLELVCDDLVLADYTVGATPSNTDQWEINAGETKNCIFRGDVKSTADAGDTLQVSLTTPGTAAVWTIKDIGTDTAVSSVVPSATITGNTLTLTAASLAVTNNANAAPNTTWVKGSTATAAAYNFAAGDAADITVTDIVVSAGLDDTTAGLVMVFIQTSNVEDVIDSISLWDGTTQVGVTKGLTVGSSDVTASFTGLSWVVPAGTTKTLVAKVAVSTNAPYGATNDFIALEIVAGDVTSQYGTGTALTGVPSSTVNGTATPTTYQTISSSGTLAVDIPSNTPSTTIAVASQDAVPFTKLKFTAANEDMKITKLALKNASSAYNTTDYDDNISSVSVTYPTNGSGSTTETKTCFLSSAVATCTGLNIFVPNPDTTGYNNYAIVDVKVDMMTIAGGADAADAPAFTLSLAGDFEATGVASNVVIPEQDLTITDVTGTAVTTGVTGAVTTTTATTIVVSTSATTTLAVGDFITIESETLYVTAITSDTAIEAVRGVNGTIAAIHTANTIYVYGTSDTTADLLTVNAMNVQGTKLTVSNGMTSKTGSPNATEEIMEFTVITDVAGDAEIRQGAINTASTATGWTESGMVAPTTDTTVQLDGTSVELAEGASSAVTHYTYFDATASAGLNSYARLSLWIQSDTAKAAGDIEFVLDDAIDLTAGDDLVYAIPALAANQWVHLDFSISGVDASTRYYGINIEANPDNNAKIYLDNIVFYNEKINVDLTLNSDVTIPAAGSTAYLKQNGTIVATGIAGWDTTGTNNETGSVTFVPTGTYGNIEISGSDVFNVEIPTNIFTNGTSIEQLTATIDLGNSSSSNTDLFWYDVEGSDNVPYVGVNTSDKISTTISY